MSFSFARKDETVAAGIRRVARQQLRGAIGEIDDSALSVSAKVHAVRRRCKKLRGLLRLVRPGFAKYDRENAALRDAARHLADLRDGDVLIETLDALVADDEQMQQAALPIRTAFGERRMQEHGADAQKQSLAAAREALDTVLDRSEGWKFRHRGFEALAPGFAETFWEMRRAMEAAEADPTPEHMHDWRKQVKYHWHHVSLLREIAPPLIAPRRQLLAMLGDRLGSHHDLAVLDAEIRQLGNSDKAARKRLRGAITTRSAALSDEAFAIGHALTVERKSAIAARHRRLWKYWRAGEMLPALPLKDEGQNGH